MGMCKTVESSQSRIEILRQDRMAIKNQEKQIKALREKKDILEKQIAELAWGGRHFSPLADRLA